MRKIIFEVLKQLKIAERLDVSNQFWAQFGMHNQKVKEKLGLYEIENIDNVKVCTIAVNPKEYFEKFEDRSVNKKHKRVKRNTRGMDFECYTGNITPLREADSKKKETKVIQKQLQVHNTEMKLTSVSKVKFTNLNNKRYYFLDGIVFLPYGHLLLSKVREVKKAFPKIHHSIEHEKNNSLRLENEAVAGNKRLQILCSIYAQPITYSNLNTSKKFVPNNNIVATDFTTTRDYILNSRWL